MIRYSFIIPHKNIPDLLVRCVDSIPKREDVDVVVVDDGSSCAVRNSTEFKEIADRGVNIILTDENLGAGHARNIGLEAAAGEWVIFSDADDHFEPGVLDSLDHYADEPYDVVFFKTQCLRADDPHKFGERQSMCERWNRLMDDTIKGSYDSRIKLMVDCVVPWGKMIRRQFLLDNNIRFETVPFSNDVVWSTLLLTNINKDKVCCSDSIVYNLTERSNSLSKKDTPEAFLCRSGVFMRRYHLLKDSGYASYEDPVNYPVGFEKAKSYGPGTLIKYFRLVKSMEQCIPLEYEVEKKCHFRYPYLYFTTLLMQSIRNKELRNER